MLFKQKSKIQKQLSYSQNLFIEFKKGRFSFSCLNISQFLGVLNDHIYKLLMIFLLISSLGVGEAGSILSATGALYVIPFLLFSSAAGILADRFSKQRIIQGLKAVEVLITALALWGFYSKAPWACYTLLFFLATHSAVFGPSKYGIIPEIVEKNNLSKANSHIISFTYLAIIIGTFLASFLTYLTNQNFVLCVSFCLLFSILGFLFSLGIQKTSTQKSTKKMNVFFPKEIYTTIKECQQIPLLAPSLLGSAFFLFIGAFTQLNIIPFAMESLHLSEYAGGYLFLLTALGIAAGSSLSSKFLRKKLDLNTSCLAGLVMTLIFWAIWALSSFLIPIMILLILLGVFGGIFVVSFETFIQANSPPGKRGQTVAAANFLGFVGVLIASFCLYLFGEILKTSAASGFFLMGILTLITTFFLMLRMSSVFLPFIAKCFASRKNSFIIDPLKLLQNSNFFILEHFHFPLFWAICSKSNKCQIIFLSEKKGFFLKLLNISPTVYFLNKETNLNEVLDNAKDLREEDSSFYIFTDRSLSTERLNSSFSFFSFKETKICMLKTKRSDTYPEKTSIIVEKFE